MIWKYAGFQTLMWQVTTLEEAKKSLGCSFYVYYY